MEVLGTWISTALISIIVPVVIGIIAYNSKNKTENTIAYPKFLPILGFVNCAGILLMLVASTFQNEQPRMSTRVIIVSVAIVVLVIFASFALYTLLFRFAMTEGEIIFRNGIGVTKILQYTDIDKISIHRNKDNAIFMYKIYIGRTVIKVNSLMAGFADFEKIIKRHLKKANNKIWHIFDEKKKN